jgi:hypothetical protein
MIDLIDLIEEAEHVERLAKRQQALVLAESIAISAKLYQLRVYDDIEIDLMTGAATRIGITRSIERRRP